VSSQDFTPAPYPFYPAGGAARDLSVPVTRARERYWLNVLLFAMTFVSTTVVGAAMQYDFNRNLAFDVENHVNALARIWSYPSQIWLGLPFSLTLLTILMAHEFGHYFACQYYHVDASLPYFLPAPTLTGTFGAFIRVRSPFTSRRALFDIGIAGPLAGFVFLAPALAVGLAFSKVMPGIDLRGDLHFGVPAIQWALEKVVFPGVRSTDIYLHPVARAAWIGALATALNLLPIGQLDGGHILYALAGRRHRLISLLSIAALVLMGVYWRVWLWLFWGVVLFWLGRRHPAIHDSASMGVGRVKLGLIALVVFLLCFTLAPIRTSGL
jgi:membrane-associated protease RseP (regulator of RpoE activity)